MGAPVQTSRSDAGAQRTWVEVVTDHSALEEHVPGWEDLAKNALEPNVFHEPWFLLPALEEFGSGQDILIVLVYHQNDQQPRSPILGGLFPLERRSRHRGLPVSSLGLWQFGNCFLSTPLIRKSRAQECLSAFFDWLAAARAGSSLMEWGEIAGDGPVHQHLIEEFRRRGTMTWPTEIFTRSCLRRQADSDTYLQAALSPGKRRDLHRKERRLGELGRLQYATLGPGDDVRAWIERFLQLEASGWKGEAGTAIAQKRPDHAFFLRVAQEGFKRQRLSMLALTLDGQPIALRCSFQAKPGSFFYKPCYDEAYARFSPGVLVELENIRHLHADPEIQWMDSCTSPDNDLLNTLWLDRRIILSILAATGRGMGSLVISALPFLRWANRRLGRYRGGTRS